VIFVTTGTQTPFDRLLRAVDAWAQTRTRSDLFAQIGRNAWKPTHIEHVDLLDPEAYDQRIRECQLVVSHAGMGSILSALLHAKPVLVMPKLARIGEHRNEHQSATAKRLGGMGVIHVAWNEAELHERLDLHDRLAAPSAIGPHASDLLIRRLRDFIEIA
jgi:UDP-N-acetylglucosamine transferase subunit ALG13